MYMCIEGLEEDIFLFEIDDKTVSLAELYHKARDYFDQSLFVGFHELFHNVCR